MYNSSLYQWRRKQIATGRLNQKKNPAPIFYAYIIYTCHDVYLCKRGGGPPNPCLDTYVAAGLQL